MEKLSMCRICLMKNVRMHVVSNTNLQEVYEKLTDVPFVTEDIRPKLACSFCYTKLKQCWQLQRKCLEAEEVLAQMLNEDYEESPLTNHGQLQFIGGFIKTPLELISIADVDLSEAESAAIIEEPAVCDVRKEIEIKVEIKSEDSEPENDLEQEDIPPHSSVFDSEVYVPIVKLEVGKGKGKMPIKKRKAAKTNSAPAAKIIRQGDTITDKQRKKQPSVSKRREGITGTKSKLNNSAVNNNQEDKTIDVLTVEKPYQCGICQHSFKSHNNLNQHMFLHTGNKPYKCDVCQSEFNHRGHFNIHMRIHTGEKPYKCSVCQHGYTQKSVLINHMRKHTGEKPFKCDICQRCYSRKSDLAYHMRLHSGDKPYKCDVCQREFKQKRYLNQHKYVHISNKPYKCNVCQYGCFIKKDFMKHVSIHTGEKPYKCEECQRSFSGKSNLKRHTCSRRDIHNFC